MPRSHLFTPLHSSPLLSSSPPLYPPFCSGPLLSPLCPPLLSLLPLFLSCPLFYYLFPALCRPLKKKKKKHSQYNYMCKSSSCQTSLCAPLHFLRRKLKNSVILAFSPPSVPPSGGAAGGLLLGLFHTAQLSDIPFFCCCCCFSGCFSDREAEVRSSGQKRDIKATDRSAESLSAKRLLLSLSQALTHTLTRADTHSHTRAHSCKTQIRCLCLHDSSLSLSLSLSFFLECRTAQQHEERENRVKGVEREGRSDRKAN